MATEIYDSLNLKELRAALDELRVAENMVPSPVARGDSPHVCESSLRAEVNKLREELDACRVSLGISRSNLHESRVEAAKLRRGHALLGEVLGLFAERSPGWYSSVMVQAEDYHYWLRATGLQ